MLTMLTYLLQFEEKTFNTSKFQYILTKFLRKVPYKWVQILL